MTWLLLRNKLQFLTGLCVGFTVCLLVYQYQHVQLEHVRSSDTRDTALVIGQRRAEEYVHHLLQIDDTHAHHDDTSVADNLAQKVRVLCWIMTAPANFRTKADAVKHTWGPRCNVLLFFSVEPDEHLKTIALNFSEGRKHLTAKSMQAFQYVYEKYYDQADWFMKADDDTYVIVENLRYFLSTKNTSDPVFYGHHFRPIVKQGYHSGGAGYVLSKEAVRRFASRDRHLCRDDGGPEDAEIGKCMEKLGIKAGNSRDSLGRSRFHCFSPETHLKGGFPKWYYEYVSGGAKQGIENISDYAITFHYVQPRTMLSMEFYVYHLRPYGIVSGTQTLN